MYSRRKQLVKVIPLFYTALQLLRITLRLQRWQWFSPVTKRGNEGPFCSPDAFNSEFDYSTGLKRCLSGNSPQSLSAKCSFEIALCCLFRMKREQWPPLFISVFYSLWLHKNISKEEKKLDSRRCKFFDMNDANEPPNLEPQRSIPDNVKTVHFSSFFQDLVI